MTCQLETWHDADLMWMTGNGHGARICGDDRWYLSACLYQRIAATIFLYKRGDIRCDVVSQASRPEIAG
jgi:hypothetical protein